MPFRVGDTAVTIDSHGKAHLHAIRESPPTTRRRRGRGRPREYDRKVRAGKVAGPPTPRVKATTVRHATRAVEKATASRPIETLRRAEARIARTRDREKRDRLREAAGRLRHALAHEAAFKAARSTPEGSPVKANRPEPALRSVAPRAYRRSLKVAEGPHGSSRGLGEPEDLTTAITIAAPGGGAVGALGRKALEVGGRKVAEDIGEAVAGKIESTAAKAEVKALKAGSGVKAAGRLAGNAARRVVGKETVKASDSDALRAAEKALARGESRTAQAAVPGVGLAKAAAIPALPATRGHLDALTHNPKGTLKTTARAIPGLVTVPVGDVAKGGIAVGRAASEAAHGLHIPGARGYSSGEIVAPVAHIPAEQLAFARQVAKVITASDPKEVQGEVEDNLGLMLPIMLGLGAKAANDRLDLTKGRITEGVRRVAEGIRERHGSGGHGYRDGKAPHVLESTRQRKEVAKIVARGHARVPRELEDRQKGVLAHARHARGSEVVREGVARGKRGKKVDLRIHDADVTSFLQRNPMRMDDPVAMLAEVRRIGRRILDARERVRAEARKKGREEPDFGDSPDTLRSLDTISYIERHPDVLANPHVIGIVREYRKQGAYAREHAAELEPEHSERARFLPAATTRDIPFPEERYPRSVRDITRAEPRRGERAKDVLRREAREDRATAKLALRKARTREEAARREGAVAAAKDLPRGSKRRLRVEERMRALRDEATLLRGKSKAAAEMAKRKHKAASEVDPTLTDEFARDVEGRLRAEGITEMPEYQHAGIGHEHGAPTYGSTGSRLTRFPGKSKMRAGTAEELGLVEEGLRPMIRESIARPVSRRESYKAAREVIERNRFEPGGKKEWSAREADELFGGPDPVLSSRRWEKVPRQLYKRIYDVLDGKAAGRAIDERDLRFVGELEALRKGQVTGTHYMIVRKAAMDELTDQLAGRLVSSKLTKVNHLTSALILGTSPAWAAMQVVAEYGQGAVAQPRLLNPAFVRKALRAYRSMKPHERQEFDSWVGVTTRSPTRAADLKLDLRSGDTEAAAEAYKALHSTPYGRLLREIPRGLSRIDRWKGGRIRALTALAKIDKDLNGRANTFIRGIGGMDREMGAALKAMRGKPLAEQAAWVSAHPGWARHYEGYVDDVMGNWQALTKNERVASQAIIFYPFLRMSLRWTLVTFPRHHPIKAAILYGLAQQNAQEVHKLLHGDPSYYTQWAMVPVDLGDGKTEMMDLSRIAPGSNALVEALGGSTEGPKLASAARIAQPAITAAITAIYGISPLSGKQEPHSLANAAAQVLTLMAPLRVAGEVAVPSGRQMSKGIGQLPVIGAFSTRRQRSLEKLSAKLREADTPARYARTLALPPIPKSTAKERDSALLGRVMRAMSHNDPDAQGEVAADYGNRMTDAVEEGRRDALPGLRKERDAKLATMRAEYEEANRVLDKLFTRWKIPHEKEENLFLKFYSEGKYGTGGSGGSGNSFLKSSGDAGGNSFLRAKTSSNSFLGAK